MEHIINLLTLGPIIKAFIAFILSGTCFPIVGVFVSVLGLVPLRFALMHGTLLGGVIALMLGTDTIIFPLIMNFLIVILLGPFSNRFKVGLSNISAFFMIFTIAIAFVLIDKMNINTMDAFGIFWGNIYALTDLDLTLLGIISVIVVMFIIINYKKITAVLFDMDVAYSLGINSRLIYYLVIMITGIIVALSIKIIGAMLVDSLLLLPAMIALHFSKSIKTLFIYAIVIGALSSIIGFYFLW